MVYLSVHGHEVEKCSELKLGWFFVVFDRQFTEMRISRSAILTQNTFFHIFLENFKIFDHVEKYVFLYALIAQFFKKSACHPPIRFTREIYIFFKYCLLITVIRKNKDRIIGQNYIDLNEVLVFLPIKKWWNYHEFYNAINVTLRNHRISLLKKKKK